MYYYVMCCYMHACAELGACSAMYIHACMHGAIPILLLLRVGVYGKMCIYISMYGCMYVCMYVCMYSSSVCVYICRSI